MPHDSTTFIVLNANGDTLSLDSLPADLKQVRDEAIHQREVQQYYDGHNKNSKDDTYMPFLFIVLFVVMIISAIKKANRQQAEEDNDNNYQPENTPKESITYNGSELKFSDEELEHVLNKHFGYYTKLNYENKTRFLQRLKKFISIKFFVIHDDSGFKEMPILISASAVQISFGLDKYLLPFFSHIHIFPEEFVGLYPTLRLLEGNVSGHSIHLSWKHFLNGYEYPDNGQNVGLHEFAHAFYYQYFDAKENIERDFVARFPVFDECGNRVFKEEQLPGNDLYSDYALTNFQEFWAESVEIFFERSADLKIKYEELYRSMCELLNQDPLEINSIGLAISSQSKDC